MIFIKEFIKKPAQYFEILTDLVIHLKNYKNKTGETLESHSTTTFLFIGGGIQLFMTVIAMWMKCLKEPE